MCRQVIAIFSDTFERFFRPIFASDHRDVLATLISVPAFNDFFQSKRAPIAQADGSGSLANGLYGRAQLHARFHTHAHTRTLTHARLHTHLQMHTHARSHAIAHATGDQMRTHESADAHKSIHMHSHAHARARPSALTRTHKRTHRL